MEKRSRRRIRDLVALAAFQGLSQNEIGCARISMMARSTNAPFKGRIQKRKTNRLQIINPACTMVPILLQKSFWGDKQNFLEPLMRFASGDSERPHRFIQNRPGTSVVALKSDTAAEKSRDQLSRDFPGRSIFDFCNNICHFRTSLR